MSRWTQLSGATALACVFTASAGFADVTADQVWGDWKSYMESFGYSVEASESRDGDTLTVSNVEMSFDIPQDEGTFAFNLPEMKFTDTGDGSVSVAMPGKSTMVVDGEAEGEEFRMAIEMDLSGMTTVVSGEPDDMTYSYAAASISVDVTEFMISDDEAPDDLKMTMTINNVTGQSAVKVGELREIAQTFTAADLSYDLAMSDEDEGINMVLKGVLTDVNFKGDASVPTDLDLEDPNEIFKSGFATNGVFSQGSSEVSLAFQEGDESFALESQSGAGELDVAIGADGLKYVGAAEDLAINVAGGDIPFPVAVSMEEIGYKFVMPMSASEDAQDFGLGLTFAGLTVPDLLWNIFDPSEILPREPATVSFDIDGTTRLTTDLTDPSIEDSDEFPGELLTLTLNDLVLELAGAELTGSGDFTFDNTDLESFDGLPRPMGVANFRLLGGNGLLDKVVQMGFVGDEDAMGARMMMGLFAVPGPAEDELNSTIEVNEEGHVLANGQRIK